MPLVFFLSFVSYLQQFCHNATLLYRMKRSVGQNDHNIDGNIVLQFYTPKNHHLFFDFLWCIPNYETGVVPTREKTDKRNGWKKSFINRLSAKHGVLKK